MLVRSGAVEKTRRTGDRMIAFLFLAVSLSLVACGSATTEAAATKETNSAAVSLSNEAADLSEHVNEESNKETLLPVDQISREGLLNILSQGPGALLAMVETSPYKKEKRFVGFKIDSFVSSAPKAIDIREGDVIRAVNGLLIITPDDFFRLFQELKVASEIRFDLLRNDEAITLTYFVVD